MRRCLVLLVTLCLFGCQKGPEPLRIYSSMDANETRDLVRTYEKSTGERVEFVRLSTGEALTRIETERKRPQVAVWMGGGSNEHVIAEQSGLLTPYQPKTDFPLPEEAHGREAGWNGWYRGVIAFASNTEFLKKEGLNPPLSYRDLLDPHFKGQIGMAYAYTAGTAYTILQGILNLMGEQPGFDFIKRLDGQIHHYSKSGSACVSQVGLGEIAVCIAFAHDIVQKGIRQGYPVVLTFPREGAPYEIGAVSIVKGGSERGRRFVDWLYSLEAQQLLTRWEHIPLHPKAVLSPEGKRAAAVKSIPVDLYQGAEKHKMWLAEWRNVTGD